MLNKDAAKDSLGSPSAAIEWEYMTHCDKQTRTWGQWYHPQRTAAFKHTRSGRGRHCIYRTPQLTTYSSTVANA